MFRNEDEGLKVERSELTLMYDMWPDNFGSLFDMGCKAFEMLFHHRPQLKAYFVDDWKESETIKKIILTLEQTLVQCVNTYGDVAAPLNAHSEFIKHLRELGGLHRIILPSLNLDNFELLFKLLPEVIVDMTSNRRDDGPIGQDTRNRLLAVWQSACGLMSRQVVLGWERRIAPTIPKFVKAMKNHEERGALSELRAHQAAVKKQGSFKDAFRKTSGGQPGPPTKSVADLKKFNSFTVFELSRTLMAGVMPAGGRARAESSGASMTRSQSDGDRDSPTASSRHPQPVSTQPLQVHDVDIDLMQ